MPSNKVTKFNFKTSDSFAIKEQCPYLVYSLINLNTYAETDSTSKTSIFDNNSYHILSFTMDRDFVLFTSIITT